jgi:hypothetical protein
LVTPTRTPRVRAVLLEKNTLTKDNMTEEVVVACVVVVALFVAGLTYASCLLRRSARGAEEAIERYQSQQTISDE